MQNPLIEPYFRVSNNRAKLNGTLPLIWHAKKDNLVLLNRDLPTQAFIINLKAQHVNDSIWFYVHKGKFAKIQVRLWDTLE